MNFTYIQNIGFNVFSFVSYILIVSNYFGLFDTDSKYLALLDYYIRIYICLFLIWRFHPFKDKYEFTELDRKIAFTSGFFILTTTTLYNYLDKIKQFFTKNREGNI